MAGLIAMVAMLVIFFVEFASSRYLTHIDEQVMAMQLRESGSQQNIVRPVTNFLTRRKVVINGKRIGISEAIAGEAAERAAETIVRQSLPEEHVTEESSLLDHPNGLNKTDSASRRDTHSGHHHYDPPPVDGSDYTSVVDDVTRKSQLLAVGIMEGGLCFHSIFVGLTLAVATGGGFISLLTAIMFHRTLNSDYLNNNRNLRGHGLRSSNRNLILPQKIDPAILNGPSLRFGYTHRYGNRLIDPD